MANVNNLLKKAVSLLQANNSPAAEKLCIKILKIDPKHIDATHLLGLTYLRMSKHAKAIDLFKNVIAANTNIPECHYHLGYSLFRMQQLELAARHLSEAFRLRPNFAEAYSYLSLVMAESGDMRNALALAQKALSINPGHPEIHTNQAIVHEKWGDQANALKHYMLARDIQPSNRVYHVNVGHALTGYGDLADAELSYEKAISMAPAYGDPYLGLARIGAITADDSELVHRLKGFVNSGKIADTDKIPMLYALGIIHEKAEKYKEAFDYYSRANALDDKNCRFSIEDFNRHAGQITSTFNRDFIQQHGYQLEGDIKPVFIVGMPRSGTSLVHQILASHPAVYGAGELNWFPFIQQNLKRLLGTQQNFPECASLLDKENVATIANDYLAHMRSLANGEKIIIDKMPVNFLYLGLIKILFPNARIIHCTRDPRDTCLSIYFNRFLGSIHYASNLSKLGAYYRVYQQVMRHWEQALPDMIHEVNYESLTESPEKIIRKALDYLDLDWDPDCLSFHKSRSVMRTASDHQVRKPIYKSSISRWKNYAPYIKELEQALAGEIKNI